MTPARDDLQRIEGAVDWFEADPTGGGGGELPFRQVADGMWLQSIQYGTGNALTVDTGDGLLQVDTGIAPDHARGMLTALREATDERVAWIVYSHGHTAYNHGVEAWLADSERRGDPRPTIVAQRNLLHQYRRYRETQEYLERVTEWQFGFPPDSIVGTHMFEVLVDPDVTYIDEMTLPTPRPIQLVHCHAETDDGTGVWFPDEKLLYGGNATIGSFPRIEAGWWDRNITSVHPAPAPESSKAILDAITDKPAVLAAARAHLAAGQLQLALHVVDLLAMAHDDVPEVVEARQLKTEIAAALAEDSPTYMSGNYYRAVAAGHPAR